MDSFAFVIHPTEISQIHQSWPVTRYLPQKVLETTLKRFPPLKVSHVSGICSNNGKEIEGYLIACPLLPHQMLALDEDFVVNKIIAAGKMGQELGARILGLGAYTSVVGDKGVAVARKLDIGVTTGNSYTVGTIIEGISKAAKSMNLHLPEATVNIVGASGSIGNACARILVKNVSRLVITARNREKLERLAETLRGANSATVVVEKEIRKAVSDAEIIIVTTSTPETLLDVNWLKPRTIVCDVAVPENVPQSAFDQRHDVLVFNGGLVRFPGDVDFGPELQLPSGLVYACIAETIVLTLEKKFEDYSLGKELSLEKVNEISALASKHGFKVATLEKSNVC